MIKLENTYKKYKSNKMIVNGLCNVNIEIQKGEYITIIGKSGAGKSTLINILGGLDNITSGKYYFENKELNQNAKSLAKFRHDNIGIIVQNYALINHKNVFYNISLPLMYRNINKEEIEKVVKKWAEYMDISDILEYFPNQLSGGQCQRVAIARALCKNPTILLADEPTGALDYENKKNVLDILKKLNKDGLTVILSTHDHYIAKESDRTILIENGKVIDNYVII